MNNESNLESKPIQKYVLLNPEERTEWLKKRIAKGYGFDYYPSDLQGEYGPLDGSIVCQQTNEIFMLEWAAVPAVPG